MFDWMEYDECMDIAQEDAHLYYPDLDSGTCLNDGNQGELQPNLFVTLDECVSS